MAYLLHTYKYCLGTTLIQLVFLFLFMVPVLSIEAGISCQAPRLKESPRAKTAAIFIDKKSYDELNDEKSKVNLVDQYRNDIEQINKVPSFLCIIPKDDLKRDTIESKITRLWERHKLKTIVLIGRIPHAGKKYAYANYAIITYLSGKDTLTMGVIPSISDLFLKDTLIPYFKRLHAFKTRKTESTKNILNVIRYTDRIASNDSGPAFRSLEDDKSGKGHMPYLAKRLNYKYFTNRATWIKGNVGVSGHEIYTPEGKRVLHAFCRSGKIAVVLMHGITNFCGPISSKWYPPGGALVNLLYSCYAGRQFAPSVLLGKKSERLAAIAPTSTEKVDFNIDIHVPRLLKQQIPLAILTKILGRSFIHFGDPFLTLHPNQNLSRPTVRMADLPNLSLEVKYALKLEEIKQYIFLDRTKKTSSKAYQGGLNPAFEFKAWQDEKRHQ